MARMHRLSKVLALFHLVLASVWAPMPRAQGVSVSFAPDSPMYQRIEPAGSGTLAFEIRNTASVEVQASVGGFIDVPMRAWSQYTVVPADPANCSAPTLVPLLGSHAVIFRLPPIAAGSRVTCRYQVERSGDSRDDLGFQVCAFGYMPVIGCGQRVRRGTLPDLSLGIVSLGAIAGEPGAQMLRLDLRNLSAVDVESRVASTDCHEFGSGFFAPTAFDVDGQFVGGCPTSPGGICFSFTGQLFDSRAFRLGPVAAGATASCLIRVRPSGGTGARQVPLALMGDQVALTNGAVAFDPERSGEQGPIGLGPSATNPVPLDWHSSALVGLLLLGTGLGALASRVRNAGT